MKRINLLKCPHNAVILNLSYIIYSIFYVMSNHYLLKKPSLIETNSHGAWLIKKSTIVYHLFPIFLLIQVTVHKI